MAERPAVLAGPSGVVVRNVVRDIWLPWHDVATIEARWSLSVATQDRTFGSWAVSGANAAPAAPPADARDRSAWPHRPPVHVVSWTVPDRLEQLRRRGLHGERTGTVEVPAGLARASRPSSGRLRRWLLLLAIPAG